MKLLLVLMLAGPLLAQETILLRPGMKPDPSAPTEQTDPDPKGGPTARALSKVSQPTLTICRAPRDKTDGTAIIVCPGGGYRQLMIDREGHYVARWLNTIGVTAIVLKYRLPLSGASVPETAARPAMGDLREAADFVRVALEDAQEAVRVARANATRWNIRPDAVGMMGFSAGGNLTAMTGMLASAEARPNFLAVMYAPFPRNLVVPATTPPVFLAAAEDDPRLSPTDHTLRFYMALKQARVPAEMHIYANGGHGFALLKAPATATRWPETFAAWLAALRRK